MKPDQKLLSTLMIFIALAGCESNEKGPSLLGTWVLISSEQKDCTDSKFDYHLLPCTVTATNNCKNTFTSTTWTTESGTILSYTATGDRFYQGVMVTGDITEIYTNKCTKTYSSNTCVTRYTLTPTNLTLILEGKVGTNDEGCLIVKNFTR